MGDLTKKSSNIINKVLYESKNKGVINEIFDKDQAKNNLKRKVIEKPVVINKKTKNDNIKYEENNIKIENGNFKHIGDNEDLVVKYDKGDNININENIVLTDNKIKLNKPAKKEKDKKLKFI